MKKIYIILMHTRTVPSKLIKFFTKYEYSHVGIALDEKCDNIYSFGRKDVNSILNAGFTVENKDGEFFKKFNKTVCRIYEAEINDEQYHKVQEIINYMGQHSADYKYDFFGIIPRFFGIPVTQENKYVCSYFVADILKKSKIYNFKKDVCLIKPQDFEKLNILNEIYTGKYNLYV